MNITIKRLESIRRVLLCFIVITVGFIWIHSMMSREVSAEESGRFVELLEPIFRRMNIGDALADHIVRKWAHFLEYAGLGGEMGILACLNRMILRLKSTNDSKNKNGINFDLDKTIFNNIRFKDVVGFAVNQVIYVAVIDETIQIFSLRGSLVSDVCLDFFGGLTGAAVSYGLYRTVGRSLLERMKQVSD